MNPEGWQAGLFGGAALVLVSEAVCRAVLFRLRHRDHKHCPECHSCLEKDGLAVGALPKLEHCPLCLDTWPAKFGDTTEIREGRALEGKVDATTIANFEERKPECMCGASFGQRLPVDDCPLHSLEKRK